jgi:ferritin
MNTIHLTDQELEMARHALQSFLQDFGHDEAETVQMIRAVIDKLNEARPDGEEPRFIA